jgi:alpha-L-fucosidase
VNDPLFASLYGPAHAWLQDKPEVMMNDWTYVSPEFANDWLARAAEIVRKYKPEVMYFDWWVGQPNYRPNVTKFAAFYYNFDAQNKIPGVIDIKDYTIDWHAGARDFERGLREGIEPDHWQTDTRSATFPGATSNTTNSRLPTSLSTNSSTSSAKMAISCSILAHAPTALFPTKFAPRFSRLAHG